MGVAALVVALVVVTLVIALASVLPFSSETARRKVIEVLSAKRDGGGSASPITITGTRREPAFGLDKGRVFNRNPSGGPGRRAPAR